MGLTGSVGVNDLQVKMYAGKTLLSQEVIYPLSSAGSKENFKLRFCLTSNLLSNCFVSFLCFHPFYFSIRTFEHCCVLDSDKGGWALVTRCGPE